MSNDRKKRIAMRRIELVIRDYFDDLYSHADDVALKTRYENKSIEAIRIYEMWAIEEIIDHIKNSDKRVLDTVEEWRDKMDDYACRNTKSSYIFCIAYDTATCVLDALIYAGYH